MQLFIGFLAFTSTSALLVQRPDKTCETGSVSLDHTVCCPAFCGECSDYPTCSSVRGQNSTTQCCKSQVLAHECGTKGVSANACRKKCSQSPPPCIMDIEEPVPDSEAVANAGSDCNEAQEKWRMRAAAIVGDDAAMQAQAKANGGAVRVPMSAAAGAPAGSLQPLASGDPDYGYYYYYYVYYEGGAPTLKLHANAKHMGGHKHGHMGEHKAMGKHMGKSMGMGAEHKHKHMGMGKGKHHKA